MNSAPDHTQKWSGENTSYTSSEHSVLPFVWLILLGALGTEAHSNLLLLAQELKFVTSTAAGKSSSRPLYRPITCS